MTQQNHDTSSSDVCHAPTNCIAAHYWCGDDEDSASGRGHVAWTSTVLAEIANYSRLAKGYQGGAVEFPRPPPM